MTALLGFICGFVFAYILAAFVGWGLFELDREETEYQRRQRWTR